jgi:YcxB-like protein
MSRGSQLISGLAPVLLFLLVWAYLLWVAPWLSARTQFLKQPAAQGQRTGSFDGDGVKWQWEGGTSVVEWKTYIRWMESKNEILICSSPIQCGIVPKRALNAEQLSELRTLLTQKIGAGLRV